MTDLLRESPGRVRSVAMRASGAVVPAAMLLLALGGAAFAQQPRESQATGNESDYYRMSTVPVPEGVVLEVGGLETLPDGRLAVATRRGDVWIIENPAS